LAYIGTKHFNYESWDFEDSFVVVGNKVKEIPLLHIWEFPGLHLGPENALFKGFKLPI
jgi:hypothetical protein